MFCNRTLRWKTVYSKIMYASSKEMKNEGLIISAGMFLKLKLKTKTYKNFIESFVSFERRL